MLDSINHSINQLRDLSPLRKLIVAVLLAVVLAQAVAMAMVARSQVQKAQWRELAEAQSHGNTAAQLPGATRVPARDSIMTVGYTPAR
jgi:hypothetical protein